MPVPIPVVNTALSVSQWGKPVTDEVNRMTPLVNALNVPVWVTATLLTGFGNVSGNQPFQYALCGNTVYLRGLIQNNTGAVINNYVNVASGLPKPATYDAIFAGMCMSTTVTDGNSTRGKVAAADGVLQIGASATLTIPVSGWVSLTGIVYHIN